MGKQANAIVIGLSLLAAGVIALAVIAVVAFAVYNAVFPPACVGVLPIRGVITTTSEEAGLFSAGTIGSDDVLELLKEAERRGDIKSLLVEVDSPGGSVVASREIYEGVRDFKKPTIAFFREVAASGGYYAAVGADEIISDPDAITGSIGARATFEDLSGLFEKIGYNVTIIKSGELKDIGDPSRPMTEKEKRLVQEIIDEVFGEFRDAVWKERSGRPNFAANFNTILDARILTGRQALRYGLVDAVGSRKDALARAASLGNITGEPSECVLEKKKEWWEKIVEKAAAGIGQAVAQALAPKPPQARLAY
ncbi:MAG: signal peptide peptidase SppA [Candidatus Micrarchaeia archaeon]